MKIQKKLSNANHTETYKKQHRKAGILYGKKLIAISLCLLMALQLFCPIAEAKKKKLSEYSTFTYNWGLSLNTEHKKPGGEGPYGWKLKEDNAFYIGKHSNKNKVVYLTFDCGYEGGYTKRILKTLKKHKIKAIFFVTKPYITSNPGLVKKMKREGHLVGNHTTTHPQMAKLSIKRIRTEITDCEKAMKKLTGYEMDHYLRPPEGNFSMRSVQVTKRLGYATIFWSLAYYDYDPARQPGASYVVNRFRTYHHNGMIPLIHATSKSNAEALDSVIRILKKEGYSFGTLDEGI